MGDELKPVTVEFECGKYSIVVYPGGRVLLLRHGDVWSDDPHYAKMLIAIAYEVEELRGALKAKDSTDGR